MPPELILDPTQLDTSRVIADREALRRINPQRFEMEQLDGILLFDPVGHIIVGFKDVRDDEFWVRGHMPGFPIMPGVLMCEAGAQLVSYYFTSAGLKTGDFVGFGGMENVRFRSPVKPGDRLILIAKQLKFNRRQTIYSVQAFVKERLVFNGDIIGVALKRNEV